MFTFYCKIFLFRDKQSFIVFSKAVKSFANRFIFVLLFESSCLKEQSLQLLSLDKTSAFWCNEPARSSISKENIERDEIQLKY